MPGLTDAQIAALQGCGANRWKKGDNLDRLYLSVYRLGLRVDKQGGQMWLGNQQIPADYQGAVQNAKVWVDVYTGEIGSRLGPTPKPLPDDIRLYYQNILIENAVLFTQQVYKQAEWAEADMQAMSIKTAATKWRKGSLINIGGKQMTVEEVSVEDTPFAGSARMICDARLIIHQFDGRYRRIDLNEKSDE